jgi:hypothetical protein
MKPLAATKGGVLYLCFKPNSEKKGRYKINSLNLDFLYQGAEVGLYRTSRPVRKSGKFAKSGLSGNQTFSYPDTGLLKVEKIQNF